MSQFELLQADRPATTVVGLRFSAVSESDFLSEAAAANFAAGRGPVWSITDDSDGADLLTDEAREGVMGSGFLSDTRLGRFLSEQAQAGHGFCLFWANDFTGLPQPESMPDLFNLLSSQLESDGSWNWELYARWSGEP